MANRSGLIRRPWQALMTALRGTYQGPLSLASPEIAKWFQTVPVSSGVAVNAESALRVSAFFAAVATISWDVASLPLMLYKRLEQGGKKRYDAHPVYRVIHDNPNPEQTTFQWRAALMVNALTTGGGYSEIQRDGAGKPKYLHHLDPDRVLVLRDDFQRLRYRVTQPGGGFVFVDPDDMIHIKGVSPNGLVGYDMVSTTREALGLAIAAERFGGKFFSNGAQLGGILATSGTELTRKNLRDAVDSTHGGVDRSHKWLVAPEGTTFTEVGINPRDSQMTELREHEVREVARFFKIPVSMIGDLSRATWSNFEQQQLQYYTQCIRPWLINIEQELQTKLISPLERSQQTIEHVTEGFLRADAEKRGAFYNLMLNSGVYSINEVRELENLPPIDDGDDHRVPMNTMDVSDPPPAPKQNTPAPKEPDPAAGRTEALITDLRQQVADSEGKLGEALRQISDLVTTVHTDVRDRAEQDVKIEALRTEAQTLTAEIARMNTVIVLAEEKLARQQTEAERDRQMAAEALRAEQEAAQEQANRLGETMNEVDAVKVAAAEAEAQLRAEVEAERQRAARWEQDYQVMEATAVASSMLLDQLRAQLVDADARQAASEAAQQEAETQRVLLAAQIVGLQADRDTHADRASTIDGQLAEAQTRLADHEQRVTALAHEATEAQTIRAQVEQRMSTLQAQLDETTRTMEALRLERIAAQMERDEAQAQTREEIAKAHEAADARAATILELEAARVDALKAHERLAEIQAQAEAREQAHEAALQDRRAADRARVESLVESLRAQTEHAMGVQVLKETERIRKNKGTPEKLIAWAGPFYALHLENSVDALKPVMRTLLALIGSDEDVEVYTRSMVQPFLDRALLQLRAVAGGDPEDYHGALEKLLIRWERERPTGFAAIVVQEGVRYVART